MILAFWSISFRSKVTKVEAINNFETASPAEKSIRDFKTCRKTLDISTEKKRKKKRHIPLVSILCHNSIKLFAKS